MSEKKFKNASALESWLIEKDVDPEKAAAVCQALFDEGYDLPSTLIGSSSEELTGYGISKPVARHLSRKLKEQQQQSNVRQRVAGSSDVNMISPPVTDDRTEEIIQNLREHKIGDMVIGTSASTEAAKF